MMNGRIHQVNLTSWMDPLRIGSVWRSSETLNFVFIVEVISPEFDHRSGIDIVHFRPRGETTSNRDYALHRSTFMEFHEPTGEIIQ